MATDYTKAKPGSYYDVDSGEERIWSHDRDCSCPTCSKARLKSVLDDIIKDARAFAPTAKRRSTKEHKRFEEVYTGTKWKEADIYEDFISPRPDKEWDTDSLEGKCFGWMPEGPTQIWQVEPSLNSTEYIEKEVYMAFISDKPMSPDMTKNDMAVMSVDQAKAVLTLKVLYNPFFNQRLKERIEPRYRNWNPTNKCWELHPSKMKDVQQICGEFYKGVQIIGQKPVLGTKFEKLLSHLTKEDKASIYRLMALKYHPDKGGSHEVMSLLNEVFKQ